MEGGGGEGLEGGGKGGEGFGGDVLLGMNGQRERPFDFAGFWGKKGDNADGKRKDGGVKGGRIELRL